MLNTSPGTREFDAIVVGSGPGGATVAKELSKQHKKVLLLERGGNAPLKEGLLAYAAIADNVPVADGVDTMRGITTGGTSALYFGATFFPPLEPFRSLGIDLANEVEQVKNELPLAPLPDELLGPQVIRVRDSAHALGFPWLKTEAMLIDQSKCASGVSHAAKWTARSYVAEAVADGATLINGATVNKVLLDGKQAVGVEYRFGVKKRSEIRRAYASKIVLAAGSLASPLILRDSGIGDVANRGFYCDPGYLVLGFVKGLNGPDLFPGAMGVNADDDGLLLGDGCLPRTLYRGFALAHRKFTRLFSHSSCIGVGVMMRDARGGELREDGRYFKKFTDKDTSQLERGGVLAEKIIKNAGGRHIFRSGLSAAHVGGVISIGEHIDAKLQTEIGNLHVCDGSVLPEHIRLPPTLMLICLGKYLAKHLSACLCNACTGILFVRPNLEKEMAAVNPTDTSPTTDTGALTDATVQPKRKGRIKKFLFRGFLGLVGLVAVAQLVYLFSGSNEWEFVGERQGVTVYSMKTPGENLKKFRGTVQVNASMSKIVMFMQDQENDLNVGFYKPREIGRDGPRIQWTDWRGEFPAPFKDRQFVVKHEFTQDPANKEVFYQITATPSMVPPDDCCVRVPRMDNYWRLIPVGNGRTEIEWVIDMDVGGFVPYFVINASHPELMYDFASRLQGFFDQKKYENARYDWIVEP